MLRRGLRETFFGKIGGLFGKGAPGSISTFEWHARPFWGTSQEKWFYEGCCQHRIQPLVVIAPRGYRKTTTARRVVARKRMFRPMEYVDSNDYRKWKETRGSFLGWLWSEVVVTAAQVVAAPLVVVVAYHYSGTPALYRYFFPEGSESSCREGSERLSDKMQDALLITRTGLTVFIGCAIVVAFRKFVLRRRLIFDDITCTSRGTTGTPEAEREAVRNVLQEVSGFERHNNVIIVTANEGLNWAFADTNPTVREVVRMPHAEPQELLDALQRMKLPGTPLQPGDLEFMAQQCPEEYVYSVRFWEMVAGGLPDENGTEEHPTKKRGPQEFVNSLRNKDRDEGKVVDRAILWNIALNLDLACEPTFPLLALGYSREVNFSDLKALFPDRSDAAERATKLVRRDSAPRRLALAIMLVATADSKTEETMLQTLAKTLPPLPADVLGEEINIFNRYVRPLTDAATTVWVRMRDADGCNVDSLWPVRGAAGGEVESLLKVLKGKGWLEETQKAKVFRHGASQPLALDETVHACQQEECYTVQVGKQQEKV